MLARRIHVYTHQIHATLHGLIQTLFQGVLLYVMLVLADTDTLRVDLDQLGQRVHQPATDADSSAYRDVVFGKLLPSDLGRGVDGCTLLADNENLHFPVERLPFQEIFLKKRKDDIVNFFKEFKAYCNALAPDKPIMLATLSVLLILFFTLFLNPIIYIAFDREFARSQGIPVAVFEYLLMMFIALTIVSCLRMVGIVLAISLLTIPQMTANLFTYSFKRIIWLSIGIGFLGCLGGLFVSYHWKVPSGASIIFVSILIYAVCKVIKR